MMTMKMMHYDDDDDLLLCFATRHMVRCSSPRQRPWLCPRPRRHFAYVLWMQEFVARHQSQIIGHRSSMSSIIAAQHAWIDFVNHQGMVHNARPLEFIARMHHAPH